MHVVEKRACVWKRRGNVCGREEGEICVVEKRACVRWRGRHVCGEKRTCVWWRGG